MNLRFRLLFVLLFLSLVITGLVYWQGRQETPANKLVVLISLDGFGADLLGPETVYLNELMEEAGNSFTLNMQTLQQSETMPSHASMLTGLRQERHGVVFNSVTADTEPFTKPTVLDHALTAGYRTSALVTKEKLLYFTGGSIRDNVYWVDTLSSDTLGRVDELIESEDNNLLSFIHLRDLDTLGHQYGWGSLEQRNALRELDQNLKKIISDLDEEFAPYERFYVITADHGGEGLQHSNGCSECRNIPLIIVKRNSDRELNLPKENYEIADTACIVLDLMEVNVPDLDCSLN